MLAPGLILAVNGSFSHARYIENAVADTTIDERVQAVPDVTGSASLSYRRPITDSLALVGLVENHYVGSRIDTTAQANYLPPYDLTDLRAGVEARHWKASLFVNNVTNRLAVLSNVAAININVPTFNRVAIQQPLTVGIDLNYRFGGGVAR